MFSVKEPLTAHVLHVKCSKMLQLCFCLWPLYKSITLLWTFHCLKLMGTGLGGDVGADAQRHALEA